MSLVLYFIKIYFGSYSNVILNLLYFEHKNPIKKVNLLCPYSNSIGIFELMFKHPCFILQEHKAFIAGKIKTHVFEHNKFILLIKIYKNSTLLHILISPFENKIILRIEEIP